MSKLQYTPEIRAEIVRAHIVEFGEFTAEGFLQVAQSPNHPAHHWFDWDDSEAARKYRLWQARQFTRIRIRREAIETVDIAEGGDIQLEVGPMLLSPLEKRKDGGGYILADTEEGHTELRLQAKADLRAWLGRYRLALSDAQVEAADTLWNSL
ncbi:MAG: hypothetical protein OXE76_04090 [Alphaproteobacteria bacterium]|nr:hypothetical protein [Alphaproteobacteria bacterium]